MIIQTANFYGRQGIALWGHQDYSEFDVDSEPEENEEILDHYEDYELKLQILIWKSILKIVGKIPPILVGISKIR